jgi:tetratricopeptide (TPR) repeat protein
MGEVYKARDSRLERIVAIKILPSADPERRQRFAREARAIAALSHPHICTVYDVGHQDDTDFLVMEYLEGETLSAILTRGPVPFDTILDLSVQIADALDTAHASGIVHRDIKPGNIFVTSRGQAKVLDFGIAKLTGAGGGWLADGTAATRMADRATTVGTTMGTVAYMSPEQARGGNLDQRSDLFSLGVVLYEMATGELPFVGRTPVAIFEQLLTAVPGPPSERNRVLPAEFDRIVGKALQKDSAARYQSAASMRDDLQQLKRARETQSAVHAAPAAAATAATGRPGRWKMWASVAGFGAAAVAAIFMYSSRPRAFNERDSVVIADITNTTGEVVFDDTLKEALDVQLRQSPFVSVLSEQRIQSTLRLMGRRAGEKLTPDVAREICERTGSKATIGGSISELGQTYVISLDASNCHTGDTIGKSQVQASGKDDVLKALGSAAEKLRSGLGESLSSIEKYDVPIQAASTASLDALKSYSLGIVTRRRQGDAAALPFFNKALEQDPDFALAHARLGTVYNNIGEKELAREQIEKAYALKDRVSEPERLYITARYYTVVEGSSQKTIDTYRVWIQTYPKDYVPRVNIAVAYQELGDFEKAAEELRTAIALGPDEPLAYENLTGSYVAMAKADEARQTLEEAANRGLDTLNGRALLYQLAALKHDQQEMARQLQSARRFPDGFRIVATQTDVALLEGQLARAFDLSAQFATASAATGLTGSAAGLWGRVGQSAAVFGDAGKAHLAVLKALAIDRNPSTALNCAFALAIVGDIAGARKLLDEMARSPEAAKNQDMQTGFKLVEALLKFRQGDYAAMDAFAGSRSASDIGVAFMLAFAKLQAGELDAAANQFKQITERNRLFTSPLVVVASLYSGRALVRAGKISEGRKSYDQFFERWKNADQTLPILVAARQEYARLR